MCIRDRAITSQGDQAEEYVKKDQPGRVPLGRIGAYENNRGGQGVITRHLHAHVLPDILRNGTMKKRYAPVRLAEVPEEKLEEWRAENKRMCIRDQLMPTFSPEMNLCCLTKTHFAHSVKLISEGNRSQFNLCKVPAVLKHWDTEGKMIQ